MPALLIALLPLIPNLLPLFIQAINQIKGQTGLTTDQIFAQAGVNIDDTDKIVIDELKRIGVI